MKKPVFNVSINKESEKNPVYNVLNVFLKKVPENNPVLYVFNVSFNKKAEKILFLIF